MSGIDGSYHSNVSYHQAQRDKHIKAAIFFAIVSGVLGGLYGTVAPNDALVGISVIAGAMGLSMAIMAIQHHSQMSALLPPSIFRVAAPAPTPAPPPTYVPPPPTIAALPPEETISFDFIRSDYTSDTLSENLPTDAQYLMLSFVETYREARKLVIEWNLDENHPVVIATYSKALGATPAQMKDYMEKVMPYVRAHYQENGTPNLFPGCAALTDLVKYDHDGRFLAAGRYFLAQQPKITKECLLACMANTHYFALVMNDHSKLSTIDRDILLAANEAQLQRFLLLSPPLNDVDLLRRIAQHCSLETLRIALSRGWNPNLSNNSLLYWAAGDKEKFRLLLRHGALVYSHEFAHLAPTIKVFADLEITRWWILLTYPKEVATEIAASINADRLLEFCTLPTVDYVCKYCSPAAIVHYISPELRKKMYRDFGLVGRLPQEVLQAFLATELQPGAKDDLAKLPLFFYAIKYGSKAFVEYLWKNQVYQEPFTTTSIKKRLRVGDLSALDFAKERGDAPIIHFLESQKVK